MPRILLRAMGDLLRAKGYLLGARRRSAANQGGVC